MFDWKKIPEVCMLRKHVYQMKLDRAAASSFRTATFLVNIRFLFLHTERVCLRTQGLAIQNHDIPTPPNYTAFNEAARLFCKFMYFFPTAAICFCLLRFLQGSGIWCSISIHLSPPRKPACLCSDSHMEGGISVQAYTAHAFIHLILHNAQLLPLKSGSCFSPPHLPWCTLNPAFVIILSLSLSYSVDYLCDCFPGEFPMEH